MSVTTETTSGPITIRPLKADPPNDALDESTPTTADSTSVAKDNRTTTTAGPIRDGDMGIVTTITGAGYRLTVRGDLDAATAPRLEQALTDLPSDPKTTLILNLSQVSFIDAAGLRVIVAALRRARSTHRPIHVDSPSRQVRRLAALCGLDELVPRLWPLQTCSTISTVCGLL